MIVNFSITNFGSIKEKQTLSFEPLKIKHLENYYITKIGKYRLLKIGLIYGANASGKTNILNALNFLRDLAIKPVFKKSEQLKFEPFLFDKDTVKQNSIFEIEFIQNKIKYLYQVEFNKNAIIKEKLIYFNPNKAIIFQRTTNLNQQLTDIKIGSKIKLEKVALEILKANTLWNNTVLGGFLKTNIKFDELQEVVDWFSYYLQATVYPQTELKHFVTSQIEEGEINKDIIINILKKADLNVSGIKIEKEEKNYYGLSWTFPDSSKEYIIRKIKKHDDEKIIEVTKINFEHSVKGEKYYLPFYLESGGTQRYYVFAGILSLLLSEPTIFPIDELEASLHPDLYRHFILMFLANSKQSQLIATTHNREILADKDLIRDDALWITDKNELSATELYSFADFDSSVIRNTTNRLNVYKSGKLGGIPNIGDYYLDLD